MSVGFALRQRRKQPVGGEQGGSNDDRAKGHQTEGASRCFKAIEMKKQRIFQEFIRSRGLRAEAGGEFINYARVDARVPKIYTWNDLRLYLHKRGAGDEIRIAARAIWRRYKVATQACADKRLAGRSDFSCPLSHKIR